MTTAIIMIVIILYLGMMIAIGAHFTKTNNSADDFYLGGRKLGPLVTAMSAEASDMSSYLLMGLPGLAYLTGLADVGWTAIGLAAGTYVNWLIVSRRVRRYSHQLDAITIPDFFAKRYKDDKNLLTLLAAIVIFVFFVPYTASGFAACGKLFNSLFGVDYLKAMIICAIIIVIYTTLGGFLAASTTDLIQSIVMTIALFIVIAYACVQAGGIGDVIANAKGLAGYFEFTHTHDPEANQSLPYGALTIVSTLAWGLGYFGMPHILLRFMATKEEQKLTVSRRIATVWVVISMGVAVLIGIAGRAMSADGKLEVLTGNNSETILIKISDLLSSHGVLPTIIAGIVLSGILAATMSTADSQLLAASSAVSQNIMVDFFKVKISDKQAVLIARGTVLVLSVIAVFLAKDPDSSVFKIVSFAWAGFGAAFGPAMLLALYWKRSNKWGALCGMLSGAVMIFVWKFAIRPLGGAWDIYELLPAFIIALVVNVVVSLITAKPDDEILEGFDEMANISSIE